MITGKIVKQILKEKGLKLSWLAKQLNLSDSTLSTRLNGDLKVGFAMQVCDIIDVSLDDLCARYKENSKEEN